MTLVGKIFTVLIFVMSLVFMAFAVAVYATHKNWKELVDNPKDRVSAEHPLGLTFRLQNEKAKHNQLQLANDELEKLLSLERLARNQALASLQSQLVIAQDSLAKEIAAHKDLEGRLRDNVVIVEKNSINTEKLTEEVNTLRADIRKANLERDEQFKKVVALVDENQQRMGDIARLKERELQLAQQLAQWQKYAVLNNIPSVDAELQKDVVPKVRGEILAVSSEGRLCEISIGSDDGLKQGHMLEVYRGGTYLGRMVIRRTKPDRAVGEMLPNKLGDVRAGDKVTSNKA